MAFGGIDNGRGITETTPSVVPVVAGEVDLYQWSGYRADAGGDHDGIGSWTKSVGPRDRGQRTCDRDWTLPQSSVASQVRSDLIIGIPALGWVGSRLSLSIRMMVGVASVVEAMTPARSMTGGTGSDHSRRWRRPGFPTGREAGYRSREIIWDAVVAFPVVSNIT